MKTLKEVFVVVVLVGSAWAMDWIWSWESNAWAPWHGWDFGTWYLVSLTFTLASTIAKVSEEKDGTQEPADAL